MKARTMLLGLLLAVGSLAAAADQRIPLPGGEVMTLPWDPSWAVAPNEDKDPHGTVRFNNGSRGLWEVSLAPLPPHPSLTADTGNLRIYLRSMIRLLENGGVTVEQEHRNFEGGTAKGFYVRAHDVKAAALRETKSGTSNNAGIPTKSTNKPKPLDYSDGYVGAISIGGRPYVFEVLWNAGGEKPASAALTALRSVRIQ
jgi:hypothetical protein